MVSFFGPLYIVSKTKRCFFFGGGGIATDLDGWGVDPIRGEIFFLISLEVGIEWKKMDGENPGENQGRN